MSRFATWPGPLVRRHLSHLIETLEGLVAVKTCWARCCQQLGDSPSLKDALQTSPTYLLFAGMGLEPAFQVGWRGKIKQRLAQPFQTAERQSRDAGFAGRIERAQAFAQQPADHLPSRL